MTSAATVLWACKQMDGEAGELEWLYRQSAVNPAGVGIDLPGEGGGDIAHFGVKPGDRPLTRVVAGRENQIDRQRAVFPGDRANGLITSRLIFGIEPGIRCAGRRARGDQLAINDLKVVKGGGQNPRRRIGRTGGTGR